MQRKTVTPMMIQAPTSAKLRTPNGGFLSVLEKWTSSLRKRIYLIISQYGILIFMLGFLLGRALILEELAPFAVAYFAVVYHLKREKSHFAFLGLIFGAVFSNVPHGWLVLFSVSAFYLVQKIFQFLDRDDLTYAPFLVLFSAFVGGIGQVYVSTGYIPAFQLLMRGVEAILAFVITFIFIQSLPIFLTRRIHYQLKQEEIVCLLILLASVMTGTVGWVIEGYSVEHILSRYLILLMAFVGGGAMGATVGVITGLILSLADIKALTQMSLLGFSGLLAGLFREGKKIGVSLGLLMGTSILTVYTGERSEMWVSSVETVIAILVFFLTPKQVIKEIAKYVPGTNEHLQSQQEYVRRVRDITAEKVLQFSDVFRQLSRSFSQTSFHQEDIDKVKTDYFLSAVTDKTCQHCWKKEQCWTRQFDYTYGHMKEMIYTLDNHHELLKHELDSEWRNTCVKIDKLIHAMEVEYEQRKQEEKLNKKVREARHLVADQLQGVAQVMEDFSKEIQKEGKEHKSQERQIMEAMEGLGLKIQRVEIFSLEHGKVDIRISQPPCNGRNECEKVIAPMISDILGENIVISQKGCSFSEGGCMMHLTSGREYEVMIGIAQAAKGGGLISGDSYATLDLGNGKYAVAISDGMGNGSRAYTESSATLNLLQQILQSGLDEGLAIKTVNSVLSLRSTDEVFATVDLALIDLHNVNTKFIKIGSSPSFIKRGEQVRSISAHNLPIGILQDIEVDVVNEVLRAGDLLIMITDGIYEANREIENQDMWLKRILREIETDDPQEVADLLLERVIRQLHNQIMDDMTVVVAKIDRYKPIWSTIPLPNVPKIQRTFISQ